MEDKDYKPALQEFLNKLVELGAMAGREWVVTKGNQGIVWRSYFFEGKVIFVQIFDDYSAEIVVPLKNVIKDYDNTQNAFDAQLAALQEYLGVSAEDVSLSDTTYDELLKDPKVAKSADLLNINDRNQDN